MTKAVMRMRVVVLILLLILTSSCRRYEGEHRYLPVPDSGWGSRDTIRFAIDQGNLFPETVISVGVRIERDFPYSEIPVVVLQYDSLGCLQTKDIVIIHVKDKMLQWGEGIHRKVDEEGAVPLCGKAREIALLHGCKGYCLHGITDIGINVQDANVLRQSSGR